MYLTSNETQVQMFADWSMSSHACTMRDSDSRDTGKHTLEAS